jgi:hypothetical protein
MLGRLRGYYIFFGIGVATLTIRAILDSDFRNSTLLYLLVPFGVSILLHELTPVREGESVRGGLGRHLRDATIIMLGSSALLFEGFICVLFFMPIYYLLVLLGFAFTTMARGGGDDDEGGGPRIGAYAIPLGVLLLSIEGLTEPTTVQRYREATHVAVVNASVAQLQANMARPIAFPKERNWYLSIFPLPHKVEAGTLKAGDVHRLHFEYRRWFFANIHRGEMHLRIAEVSPRRIRTEILRDDSYLSHYMRIEGTEVNFTELGDGRTRVALTVKYRRLLDPYWYFGPLQQAAAKRSAEYLIQSIIAREAGHA